MSVIANLLKDEEALRLEPYTDSKGYWTIGYGHLIDRRLGGRLPPWVRASFPIEVAEAEQMLQRDIAEKEEDLDRHFDWWRGLDEVRQAVLLSMCFQMGMAGLLTFRNTLAHIKDGDWDEAALGMLSSNDSPSRAERHAEAMRTGESQWPEA